MWTLDERDAGNTTTDPLGTGSGLSAALQPSADGEMETRPLSTGDATTTGLPKKVAEDRSGDNLGVR